MNNTNNIVDYEIKEIKDLTIPIESFKLNKKHFYECEFLKENNKTIVSWGDVKIIGIEQNGNLLIENIRLYDDFAGIFYFKIFIPALKQSKGFLTLITYWKEDENPYRLISRDGIITDQEMK